MKKVILSVVLASVALMSGCAQRVADLTVASTKNMNLASNNFDYGPRVTGTDERPVFIVPLGIPEVKAAADRAIEQDRCAVGMKDVVVTFTHFDLFFGFYRYDVTGNLIIDKNLPGCADWKYTPIVPVQKDQPKTGIGSDLKV